MRGTEGGRVREEEAWTGKGRHRGKEAMRTSCGHDCVTLVTVFPDLLRGTGPQQDGHHPPTVVTNGGTPGFLHKPFLLGGIFFLPRIDHQSPHYRCHNSEGASQPREETGTRWGPGWALGALAAPVSDPGPPSTQPSV